MQILRIVATTIAYGAMVILALKGLLAAENDRFLRELAVSSQETRDAMMKSKCSCTDGLELKIEQSGKAAYSRWCESPREGKYEEWENGHKAMEGQFKHGKREGTWTSYRSDGSVQSMEEYRDGIKIAEGMGER